MEILYNSTRTKGEQVTASQAILKGLSDDGGLFVPERIPVLDKSLEELYFELLNNERPSSSVI